MAKRVVMVLTAVPQDVTATGAKLRGMVVGVTAGRFEVEPLEDAPRDPIVVEAGPPARDGEVTARVTDLQAGVRYRVRLLGAAGEPGSWQEFVTLQPGGEPDPLGGVGAAPPASGGAGPSAVGLGSVVVANALAGDAGGTAGLASVGGTAAGSAAVLRAVAGADRQQAELLASAAILSGFDRMLDAQMNDVENDAVDAIANEFPDLSERERVVIVGEEVDREREFRAKARQRMRRGLQQALAIRDKADRERRLKVLLEQEERFAKQRRKAILQRALGRVEKERVREASPDGAYWALSPYVKTHTPDCVAMAGKVWPWQVLDSVFPPLHGECPCQLLAVSEAKKEGLPGAGDFVDVTNAWEEARRALAMSDDDAGRVREALDDGLALEVFRWEPGVDDDDPFGFWVAEAARGAGRDRDPERYTKGTDKGGEFKPRRGAAPGRPTVRGRGKRGAPAIPDLSDKGRRDFAAASDAAQTLRERGHEDRARHHERELMTALEDENETKIAAERKRATDAVAATAEDPVPAVDAPAAGEDPRDLMRYTATFPDGHVEVRENSRRFGYTHAVMMSRNVSGPNARSVSMFASEEHARLRAGKTGKLVKVEVELVKAHVPDAGGPDSTDETKLYGPTAGGMPGLPRFGPEDRYELRYSPLVPGDILLWDREADGGKGKTHARWGEWDLDALEHIARQQNADDKTLKGRAGESTVTPAQGLAKLENVPTAEQAAALAANKIKPANGDTLPAGFAFDPDATAMRREGATMVLGTTFFRKLKADRRESAVYRHLAARLHEAQDDEVADWRFRPKEVGDAYVAAATGRADGLREANPDLLRSVASAARERGLPVHVDVQAWLDRPIDGAPPEEVPDQGLQTRVMFGVPVVGIPAPVDTPGTANTRGWLLEEQGRGTTFDEMDTRFSGVGWQRRPLRVGVATVDGESTSVAEYVNVHHGTRVLVVPDRASPGGWTARVEQLPEVAEFRQLARTSAGQIDDAQFLTGDPDTLKVPVAPGVFATPEGALTAFGPSGAWDLGAGGDADKAKAVIRTPVPFWSDRMDPKAVDEALSTMSGRQTAAPTDLERKVVPEATTKIERFADGPFTAMLARDDDGRVLKTGYQIGSPVNGDFEVFGSIEQAGVAYARELAAKREADRKAREKAAESTPVTMAARAFVEAPGYGKGAKDRRDALSAALDGKPYREAHEQLMAAGFVSNSERVSRTKDGQRLVASMLGPGGQEVVVTSGFVTGNYDAGQVVVKTKVAPNPLERELEAGRVPAGQVWETTGQLYADMLLRSREGARGNVVQDTLRIVDGKSQKGSAAHHTYAGEIVLNNGKDVQLQQRMERYLQARKNGTATEADALQFADALSTLQHELAHGLHPGGQTLKMDEYRNEHKVMEEALTEEYAILDTFDVLRERGLTDVEEAMWADYAAGGYASGGSYRQYRTSLATVLTEAGVTDRDDREEIVRTLKRDVARGDRFQWLGRRLAMARYGQYGHGVTDEQVADAERSLRNALRMGSGGEPSNKMQQHLVVEPPAPITGGVNIDGRALTRGARVQLQQSYTDRKAGKLPQEGVVLSTVAGETEVRLDSREVVMLNGSPFTAPMRVHDGDGQPVRVPLEDLPDGTPRPLALAGYGDYAVGDEVQVKGRGVGQIVGAQGGMVGIVAEDGVVLWYSPGSPLLNMKRNGTRG